jgi:RNA-binding protein
MSNHAGTLLQQSRNGEQILAARLFFNLTLNRRPVVVILSMGNLMPRPHAAMKFLKQLNNTQIAHLKALAQKTGPAVRIGKAGLSEAFMKGFDEMLASRELVKARFSEFKEQKAVLAPQMAEKTRSELIWIVGNMAVFYRENPDPARRKISFPAPRRVGPPFGPSSEDRPREGPASR